MTNAILAAHSAQVNNIIKKDKKFEVWGKGSPSKARHVARLNKF